MFVFGVMYEYKTCKLYTHYKGGKLPNSVAVHDDQCEVPKV